MENNRFKSDEQSFLRLSQQREQSKRLKALFDNAAGEEEISLRDENVKHFNLGANRHQAVSLFRARPFPQFGERRVAGNRQHPRGDRHGAGPSGSPQPRQPYAGGIPAADGWRQHGLHHRKRSHVRVAL